MRPWVTNVLPQRQTSRWSRARLRNRPAKVEDGGMGVVFTHDRYGPGKRKGNEINPDESFGKDR